MASSTSSQPTTADRWTPTAASWTRNADMPELPSCLEKNKGKILVITAVALLAIAMLIAGGLLLYFNVNTIAAWTLIGAGGLTAAGDVIGGIISAIVNWWSKTHASYTFVSWNVGTLRDYENVQGMKKLINEGLTFLQAFTTFTTEGHVVPQLTEEELQARKDMFSQAFLDFGNPDFICLQESYQLDKKIKVGDKEVNYLEELLPPNYAHWSYSVQTATREILKECTIVWNPTKFTALEYANVTYDLEHIRSANLAPDTIVLFADNTTGTTICVCNTHSRGFSLAYESLNDEGKKRELNAAKAGDNQTLYDLAAMNVKPADVYVLLGDLNATPTHYKPRFDIITGDPGGFVFDVRDTSATIFDANLKEPDETPSPARLDYICAKGGANVDAQVRNIRLKRTELDDLNRPSDHLPVGAKVSITYRA